MKMKVMKAWKRNAVVAAIVLFVCVAVYLNWSYGQTDTAASVGTQSESNSTRTLGEAELVGAEDAAPTAGTEDVEALQELVEESSYFDTARLTRQEARDEALAILQATVEDPAADESAIAIAGESITAMAATTLTESNIESLVTAKGYSDCVAYIGDNSVSVVVGMPEEETLGAADVAKITDIVLGQTDFSADQVKVIEAD